VEWVPHYSYLHTACDPVDDLGHVASGLGHALAGVEEGRVVVVAPELADDEQGLAEVALAVCI
jgi:hypothetical protein